MNKEIILLIEELKQQVEECRDRDSSNYIDSLLKRTDWVLEQLKVNNSVLDDVSNLLCGSFNPDNSTSSATKCKCGREKWEHHKAT